MRNSDCTSLLVTKLEKYLHPEMVFVSYQITFWWQSLFTVPH